MVANDALMQFQADILGVPVIRPKVVERDGAGRSLRGRPGGRILEGPGASARPTGPRTSGGNRKWTQAERERQMRLWKKAVTKSMDWVDDDVK